MSTTTTTAPDTTTLAPRALGVAAGIKAAGIGQILATHDTAAGKRIDAAIKAGVALAYGLDNGAILVPQGGRVGDILAERYPTLGSKGQIGNLVATGRACAILGDLVTPTAARAIHSAKGYGVATKALHEMAAGLVTRKADEASIVKAYGEMAATAKTEREERARKAADKREEERNAQESGEAVTVKAGASREARLSSAGKVLSVVRGTGDEAMTEAERLALATVLAHAERIMHEAGLTREALEAEIAA
jgi:hypothetical protein